MVCLDLALKLYGIARVNVISKKVRPKGIAHAWKARVRKRIRPSVSHVRLAFATFRLTTAPRPRPRPSFRTNHLGRVTLLNRGPLTCLPRPRPSLQHFISLAPQLDIGPKDMCFMEIQVLKR